jgi:hypothetical protein
LTGHGPVGPAFHRAGAQHIASRIAKKKELSRPLLKKKNLAGHSPLPELSKPLLQKKNLAGHSPLSELSRPLLQKELNRPIPKKNKQAKSTGHHRANRTIGPDRHRATG